MDKKTNLKVMKCPTCGAPLKAENDSSTITCVYCGNSIVPVSEASSAPQKESISGGVLKVEIKTSSSALAYMEQFFEEYDWEAFAYAQTLSVAEIDRLADSLRKSSADDKNTWFVCFKAIYIPFIRKVGGCKQILASVIEEYKIDNLDAYSKFDAYKRIAAMVSARKDSIVANLEKISANAAKYGASDDEVSELNADIQNIRKLAAMDVYGRIEDIPAIAALIQAKNVKIAQTLAAEGINAANEYARAKNLIAQKRYVEALNILVALRGYSDSGAIIEKIDKYFLISDVLEIDGELYYFKQESPKHEALSLFPTADGEVAPKAIIKKIGKIVTNYADILYYLDDNNKLRKYNLAAKTEEKIYKKRLDDKAIYSYGRKAFFLSGAEGDWKYNLVELNLATGGVRVILEGIGSIVSLTGNKMVYTVFSKTGDNINDYGSTLTNIINLDTMDIVKLGPQAVSVEGFVDNCVVYTRAFPDNNNKNLYIRALNADAPEQLIEKNIYEFCSIIAKKLFYYVGSARNKSLITINLDGSERKEWLLYVSKVLFEQGGWVYFIRRAGYNAILCKSRLDGSEYKVIAADIEEFIEIKNGYLYYINDDSALVKVRMDGSNLQKLCEDVETVLSVKEDKIIFVSVDVGVKSIYSVEFSGVGKMKLAYNIKTAKEYDENTVYYIATHPKNQAEKPLDALYRLNVQNNSTQLLLGIEGELPKEGCYVATAVYGSYDCPQVWTLRRYRDNVLAQSWMGRAFIKTYYATSPTLVKWFGETKWFKNMWKGTLDRMVSKLQADGVESTPYNDRPW